MISSQWPARSWPRAKRIMEIARNVEAPVKLIEISMS
jgi:hypothetical protein